MATERKPFQPLDTDIDDKLEKLARNNGVGTMTKPEPAPSMGGEGPLKPQPGPTTVAIAQQSTPRDRMKNVSLDLPDYVWTDVKIRAAQDQTSMRYIIMKALRAEGITIKDVDMIEDGRQNRGGHDR